MERCVCGKHVQQQFSTELGANGDTWIEKIFWSQVAAEIHND
jgi:hypothetical protein